MDVDRRINNGGVAMIILFDLFGGITRDSDEIIRLLGGGEIGFAEGLHQETEEEFDERIEDTETGIFEIAIIRMPIILGGDVTITDMGGARMVGEKDLILPCFGGCAIGTRLSADGFGFGAGNRDNEVIMAEVEVGKIVLAQRAEDAAEGGWENVEPAGFDRGVLEPVDAFFAVLGGINGGVGIEMVEFEKDFFGTTFLG